MTTRKSLSTAGKPFAAGLIVAGVGVGVQYLTGVPGFPLIPPGPFILIGAGLLVIFIHRMWAIVVGLLAALFVTVGAAATSAAALDRLADPGDIGPLIGTAVQWLGLLAALVFGVTAVVRSRRRTKVIDRGNLS